MARFKKIVLIAGFWMGVFLAANARNLVDARMATIVARGDHYEVNYYQAGASLDVYVPPPTYWRYQYYGTRLLYFDDIYGVGGGFAYGRAGFCW